MLDDAQLAEILFAPLTINELTIENRIVMSPMSSICIRDDPQPNGAANVSIELQEAS